jgi:hypothetical protein
MEVAVRAALSLDGVWEARLDAEPSFGRRLAVPMPWQAADPTLREHAGTVWYRREVELPSGWAGQAIGLRFGAVDYQARVWVNGQDVGGHAGGYTPFELDVTAQLHAGRNEIVLRVDDPAEVGEIPHGKQGGRWYTPVSGPWQSVALLARPHQRVGRVRIYPDALRAVVTARVECLGLSGPVALAVEVVDGDRVVASAAAVAAPGVAPLVELVVPEPRRWSPDDPHLYRLRATLGDDVLEERFGLRTVEARDGQILLNGQPLYVRGALDQAYWPATLYTVPSDEEIEREIRLAKELGLNLLRKHIKPEDPRYLDACDRLGMLIWAEPANPDRFTEAARGALRRDLLEMVERDFNRPSVIVWSLYNEDWGVPELFDDAEQQRWVADLYAELRRVDPTRPICDNSGWAHVITDINDYHEYYAAPERIGRFRERLDFLLGDPSENFVLGRASRGEPILVSEFGNWGLPDPALARERSGGEPAWFSYYQEDADNPTDRMKRVAGFEERFARLGLDAVFGSPSELCAFLQRRAARALTAQIEEMRSRPRLRGYVVTELTDLEWEGNGWLDYWRQPKTFHAALAAANAPLALIARPERRGFWAGEPIVVGLRIANDTGRAVEGVVRWSLEGAGAGGELPAAAPAWASVALPVALRLRAPAGGHRALRLELVVDGAVAARTRVELLVADGADAAVEGTRLGAVGLERLLRQRLERFGYRTRGPWRQAPAVVATQLDEPLLAYLAGGGRVLYLAGATTAGAELAGLRFFRLPPGESWRMAAGAAWARTGRLAPLTAEVGWEAEAIFPHQVVDAGSLAPGDEVLAGWLEGWLANPGALALVRAVGAGRLVATTFRFEDAYGVDPAATLLLNRLIRILLA